MQALLEFFKKHGHWFVFLALETISMMLLFQFNSYQGSVWFTATNSVTAKINGFYHEAEAYLHLKEVNRRLEEQNAILQVQNRNLRTQLKDSTHTLSKGERLVLDSLEGYTLYQAKVVSATIIKNDNYIIIDKGFKDGIEPEMGVVGGGGVVGIVCMVNDHYSMVLPIIHVNSNISCRIRQSGYYGSLQWRGGNTSYAQLVGIPQHGKPKVGDVIETSGYSTVFPPGLFVGKVRKIKDAPDGLSIELDVHLGTNFGNLQDVSIFKNQHKADIKGLHERLSQEGENEKKK